MNEPGDRLRALRIKKGFASAADAAQAYGWNENTYKSHENNNRGIKPETARKYAAAFGSSAAHILGIGNTTEIKAVNDVISVPVIARVSAGAFRYDEPIESEGVSVPAVLRKDVAAADQYSVIIDGPSVNKKIPDGAYAICVPYDKYPGGAKHGDLVHVVRERAGLHENTIKELRYTAKGQILMPVSTDPRHQEPVQLSTGEDGESVYINGIVIGAYIPLLS